MKDANAVSLRGEPVGRSGRKFLVIATRGSEELFRDEINPNAEKERNRFVSRALQAAHPNAKGPDDWPPGDRTRLLDEVLGIATVPPGQPAGGATPPATGPSPDPRGDRLEEMSQEIRAAAEALLDSPDLVKRVSKDIARVGVAGEEELALTLYLVGVSVQLPTPLSAIVKGASSSGKSFAVRRVAELFPDEVVMWANSLTTNALYYMPPGSLVHRFVVAGERSRVEEDERAEATRALRDLISDGVLDKWVPMKVGTEIKTVHLHQDGPIAFVESTTLADVFDEDQNRCLILQTDEREEQTRKILEATARAAAGLAVSDAAQIRVVHHAAQRMIPRCRVVVPYADRVSKHFPTDRVEARRNFPHLLRLAEAVCLLHFRQRKSDPDGNLIATAQDYKIAERLARTPLYCATGGISNATAEFFHRLQKRFPNGAFDSNEARRDEKAKKRTVYSWLSQLNTEGLVEQTEPHKGAVPAKWQLTGKEPTDAGRSVPDFNTIFPPTPAAHVHTGQE